MSSEGAPPRPPFRLAIGVTGHRSNNIANRSLAPIERRLAEVLSAISAAADAVLANEGEYFAPGPAKIALVSPLADGADQIAAEAALAQGFSLQVVLPLGRADYDDDFDASSRALFDDLLARASSVVELAGTRGSEHDAYLMAGRATLAHSDVLIAVWDGQDSRGPGGTAEIVQLALIAGQPIIHVPTDADTPVSILWGGFDPQVLTTHHNRASAERPFDADTLGAVLTRLLAPPADLRERGFLQCYFAERERHLLPRIEYPLMLALTGVRRFSRGSWRAESYASATHDEWRQFRENCITCHGVHAGIDPLEGAYCWADRLARHFAQSYRSGHVFNFMFAAIGVLIALTGLLVPGAKLGLAVSELVVILLVIINTHIGVKSGWHRRWLDYRHLAERLRPMRSLQLLGVATQGSTPTPDPRHDRWLDWYAAAMWRAVGAPAGTITPASTTGLVAALGAEEIAPQVAYHERNAEQVDHLDHRLHLIGTGLFVATIIGCLVLIGGLIFAHDWTVEHAKIFVVLSAGLPALGTAIFGIRVQGDFGGTALRSRATALRLQRICDALDDKPDLLRAADLFEEASRAMRAELGEWRLAHQQHELVIPALFRRVERSFGPLRRAAHRRSP